MNSKTSENAAQELARNDEEPATEGMLDALAAMDPLLRHADLAGSFSSDIMGIYGIEPPLWAENTTALNKRISKAVNGDRRLASRILASQAVSLDTMFTALARRAGANMGEYPHATDRYMRLALKAQSNCRATLEALARLHMPREQTIKHVHVNEGGQAIVADQFHNHGGSRNEKSHNQSHATRRIGDCEALPCSNSGGNGVPISSCEDEASMQNARRDESRRT
jgi:hypothetical protein